MNTWLPLQRRKFLYNSIILILAAYSAAYSQNLSTEYLSNWPQWRGPLSTGVAPTANPPTEWNEDKNIHWKIPIEGRGHSSPIVWDNLVFITTAIPLGKALEPRHSQISGAHDNTPVTHKQQFVAMAINRESGKIEWENVVHEQIPHEGAHYTASLASASPVTNGNAVYFFFGSFGLYCLDFDGSAKWQHDFGDMTPKHGHGEGSSPAIFKNTIVVNWDHEEQSFVAALNATTGEEIWRREREEVTSWATPIIVEVGEHPQVIVNGSTRIRGYDLKTGNTIWECGGLSNNVVASPVYDNGILYAGSSYEIQSMMAIEINKARGDLTKTSNVLWKRTRGTPYVPSLLLHKEHLYFLRHYQPILTRMHGPTNTDKPGPLRLNGLRNIYASPVAASDRVYITDQNGLTMVLSDNDNPQVLAMNQLEESFSASMAIVGTDIFLRGEIALYRISEDAHSDTPND